MDTEENLISIIVPVYNVQDYLAQCIKSIISQDYKNIEIIVGDNCSTDGTFERLYCDFGNHEKIILFQSLLLGLWIGKSI